MKGVPHDRWCYRLVVPEGGLWPPSAWGRGEVCLDRMAGRGGRGGRVQCWVRVHLLMPPGVPLEDEWDHLCGSLEPVLDSGSNV